MQSAPPERAAAVAETPRRTLTTFDLTALVVGAVVGADIYVAASLTVPLVGSSSLLLWLGAGAVAFVVALSFAACARMVPSEGGAYAYAREAFGPFAGFLVGWCLLLAEVLGAAVFPVAFVAYLHGFFPAMAPTLDAVVKVAFVGLVLALNLLPSGGAGRMGAVLSGAKLLPLLLLVALGAASLVAKPDLASAHFEPFVAGGPAQFATAFMVIFWAYTGFEVATLPAGEVKNPRRAIPLAIAIGLGISLVVYLLVNAALVVILPQAAIAASPAPLVEAARVATHAFAPGLAAVAAGVLGFGALLSILGADQAAMMGGSRLAHALSVDGYLPARLAKLSPSSGAPVAALVALAACALALSLLGGLTLLIGATVFFVAVSFLTTAAAALRLRRKDPFRTLRSPVVPVLGIAAALALLAATGPRALLLGASLLLLAVPLYRHFQPRRVHPAGREYLHRHPTAAGVERRLAGLLAGPAWWLAKRRQRKVR